MEKQALLKRGFVDNSYEFEGEKFSEFKLTTENFDIEIIGVDMVEINNKKQPMHWLTVPNCKTIKDLDDLIRLFKNK